MTELDDSFNPHYWLAAHGVRSHYFVWAVAHGALDDIDPVHRYEHWTQTGLWDDVEPLTAPDPPRRRLYRSRPPNKRDAGDARSLRIFRRYFPHTRVRDGFVLR